MIKFFRHIRKALLVEGRFGKYLLYAIGEIILVVIGILIALQINNQNELRKEGEVAKKYLEGFVSDLTLDRQQIDTILLTRKQQLVSTKALLGYINEKEFVLDSFYKHYFYILPFYRYSPNTNTLEEVLNSSGLRLIDEDIKSKLLDLRGLYTEIRLNEEHVYEDRVTYLYGELTLDHVELDGLNIAAENASYSESEARDIYLQDANYFIEDRYFKSFLNLMKYNLVYLIPRMEGAKQECTSIIQLIEEKLDD